MEEPIFNLSAHKKFWTAIAENACSKSDCLVSSENPLSIEETIKLMRSDCYCFACDYADEYTRYKHKEDSEEIHACDYCPFKINNKETLGCCGGLYYDYMTLLDVSEYLTLLLNIYYIHFDENFNNNVKNLSVNDICEQNAFVSLQFILAMLQSKLNSLNTRKFDLTSYEQKLKKDKETLESHESNYIPTRYAILASVLHSLHTKIVDKIYKVAIEIANLSVKDDVKYV